MSDGDLDCRSFFVACRSCFSAIFTAAAYCESEDEGEGE
jgi:hypothetical protein